MHFVRLKNLEVSIQLSKIHYKDKENVSLIPKMFSYRRFDSLSLADPPCPPIGKSSLEEFVLDG